MKIGETNSEALRLQTLDAANIYIVAWFARVGQRPSVKA